jgi:hypothetical protein
MSRKSFSIHADFYDEVRNLTAAQRGDLLLALINWASDEEILPLAPESAMLFRLMCAQIERISRVNSSNGAQGGRPRIESEENNKSGKSEKNEQNEKSEEKRKKPTVTVTDSVSDTDSVTNNQPKPRRKRGGAETTPKTKFAESVGMTDDEYASLVARLGEQGAARCIEILDNYKGAHGKTYKSDYKAILSWVVKRYEEEARGQPVPGKPPVNTQPGKTDPFAAYARRAFDAAVQPNPGGK